MQKHPCSSDPENELWGNPCDYKNDSVAQNVAYTPEMSRRIASQAKHAFRQMEEYKDMFALRLHSYPSFEELLIEWEGYEWLRKLYEDVLPRNKTLFKPVPDNEMEPFLKTKLKETLPHMYKALKMVLAGLYSTVENGLSDNIYSDEDLKNNIVSSINEVRAVLCQFHDVMLSLNLEIIPLDDSEVPDFREDRLCLILLIYRDSMNYLEYLAQVFQMEHDRRDL